MGFVCILWLVMNVPFFLVQYPTWYLTLSITTSYFLKVAKAWTMVKWAKLIMVRSIQMPDVGTCNSELLTRLLEWMGPIYAKIVKFRVSWHFYKLQRQSNCAFGVYFQAIQSEDQNVVAAMVRFIGRLWHFVVEDRRLEVRGITWNSSIVNEGVVVRTKFPIESKIHSFRSQFS